MDSFNNRCASYASPEYMSYIDRLNTFTTWPIQIAQTKESLARAGFWYTTLSDKVECFSCGISLMKWNANDDPWKEHETYSKDCEYLKMTGFNDADKYGIGEKLLFPSNSLYP